MTPAGSRDVRRTDEHGGDGAGARRVSTELTRAVTSTRETRECRKTRVHRPAALTSDTRHGGRAVVAPVTGTAVFCGSGSYGHRGCGPCLTPRDGFPYLHSVSVRRSSGATPLLLRMAFAAAPHCTAVIRRDPPRRTPSRMREPPLRYTGVAAVVVVWTTLPAAAALTGFDLFGDEPLSHLGTQPRSALLFTLGLAVPALLLTAFHHYLRARYPLSRGFSLAMLAGLAGQMVAAFVPIGGEPAVHRVHTTSALVLGASLPLLMWRFAAGQSPGHWRWLSYTLFWCELAACVVGIYLSALAVAPVAEILPGVVFHAWVVTVTLAGRRVLPVPERQVTLPALAGGKGEREA